MASLTLITRVIDAKTRDWKMVKGERQVDPTKLSQVLFLLTLQYNSSPAFPGMGSKLHLLNKVTEDIDTQLSQEVERALRPLTESGEIKNLETAVTVEERPALDPLITMDITYEDAAGRPEKTTFQVSF